MTTPQELIIQVLQGVPVQVKRDRRIYIPIFRDELMKTMNILSNELNIQHLSTITARDTGKELEILYHFFLDGVVITVRTTCPREDPSVDSIVAVFPSAVLYERELNDILGIVPKGHPDLRRLVLPDDWVGGYPLRKDWKPPQESEES